MRFERVIREELDRLVAAGVFREPDDGAARLEVERVALHLGAPLLDASSNDYLGFAGGTVSRETDPLPGAAASRVIHGSRLEHLQLEAELANWVAMESALLFSSAFAANSGLVAALGVKGSVIVSDAANHASLIDGARLAKADVRVIPHLDMKALEFELREQRGARACWVVTESYFSMDGDGPDLRALRDLCDAEDACLIVDEAHALGVFGERGAGRCGEAGVQADVVMGALGKAVGTHGGFVCSSKEVRAFLWNRARSFVFSTAPSPRHAAVTLEHVRAVQSSSGLRARLDSNCAKLRALLEAGGVPLAPGSFGPIVSVVLGGNERALAVARRLCEAGILAHAVRPPTVPAGSSRLRVTVKAGFGDAEILRLARAIEGACRES